MYELAQIFFTTLLVSSIGSLQLGPISLTVIFTTLKHDLRSGLLVAFTGILPEFFYSVLAFYSFQFLASRAEILDFFELAVIPLFVFFGIKNYMKVEKHDSVELSSVPENALRTFKYGMLNPLLITFWVLSLMFISKMIVIDTMPKIMMFSLAAGAGGFLTKCTFALLTLAFRNQVFLVFKKFAFNKILGVVFLVVAFIQCIKAFM
jgi:threonine/homoserine/homoserine lactone efflux protein